MKNLYNYFKDIVEKHAHDWCLSNDKQSFTYQDTIEEVNKIAEKIIDIPKYSVAIIYLPKSIDIVLWQLALNKKGVVFLTLEWGQESRLNNAISQIKPSMLITLDKKIEKKIVIRKFSDYKLYKECSYIVSSSGSTGTPKQILLRDKPILNVINQQAKLTNMKPGKALLWLLNPAFDASLSDIYMTILNGGHLIVVDIQPYQFKKINNLVNKFNITHFDLPPVLFHLFNNYLEKNPNSFSSLRHIVFGGEKADEKNVFKLMNRFNLYNAYGPSETTICSSMVKVDKNWTSKNIGTPLKGVFYKIVNNELHIGGEQCAIGYSEEDLNTRFYFEKDNEGNSLKWFKTGDIVTLEDNTYFYHGRVDRQFKHNGQLICPEEIEYAAYRCGANTAKVTYKDKKITLKYNGENFDKLKLVEYIPTWCIPHHYEKVDIQVNKNWKII